MSIVDDVKKILHIQDKPAVYRSYRLFGGMLYRQDVKEGEWRPLTQTEANDVLKQLVIDDE